MTTLLAVDDSLTMRKVLEITFAGEPFETVLASNAQEALDRLHESQAPIALVDITLGDESGYDLCQRIKADAPGTRVVLMSSKQNPYDAARGAAVGADDHVDKPFDTQALIDKVKAIAEAPAPRAAAAPAPAPEPAPPPPRLEPLQPAAPPPVEPAPRGFTEPVQALQPISEPPPPPAPEPEPMQPQPMPPAAAQPEPMRPAPIESEPPAPAPTPVQPPAAPAPVAAASSNGANAGFENKLSALGLTPEQVQGVLALSKEVVEQAVWEVVPTLAETLIREEIQRLTRE